MLISRHNHEVNESDIEDYCYNNNLKIIASGHKNVSPGQCLSHMINQELMPNVNFAYPNAKIQSIVYQARRQRNPTAPKKVKEVDVALHTNTSFRKLANDFNNNHFYDTLLIAYIFL